jgi:RNase P/RNase MRP subunit p29
MVYGKYFNKGVKALDSPHVGHVVKETKDMIVVLGPGDDRYDIPKSDVKFAAANVLVNLPHYEIIKRYKVSREDPLPADEKYIPMDLPEPVDLATYEGKYPKSLFNKGVRTQDEEHVGHIMKETNKTIVIWGHYDWHFDVPKTEIIAVGRNVILGMDYKDVFTYKKKRDAPLPK